MHAVKVPSSFNSLISERAFWLVPLFFTSYFSCVSLQCVGSGFSFLTWPVYLRWTFNPYLILTSPESYLAVLVFWQPPIRHYHACFLSAGSDFQGRPTFTREKRIKYYVNGFYVSTLTVSCNTEKLGLPFKMKTLMVEGKIGFITRCDGHNFNPRPPPHGWINKLRSMHRCFENSYRNNPSIICI